MKKFKWLSVVLLTFGLANAADTLVGNSLNFQSSSAIHNVPTITGPASNPLLIASQTNQQIQLQSAGTGGIVFNTTNTALSTSNPGGNVYGLISNTSQTSGSNAQLRLQVASTGGDPFVNFIVGGGSDWYFGPDISDSETLKIGTGDVVGTNTLYSLDNGGTLSVLGNSTITGGSTNDLTLESGANRNIQLSPGSNGEVWVNSPLEAFSGIVTSGLGVNQNTLNTPLVIDFANGSNSTSSSLDLDLAVGGPLAGNPVLSYHTGSSIWAAGVDNTTQNFVIANGALLSSNPYLTINQSSGVVSLPSGLQTNSIINTTNAPMAITAGGNSLTITGAGLELDGSNDTTAPSDVSINAGNATSGNNNGADVNLNPGSGFGTGLQGNVNVSGNLWLTSTGLVGTPNSTSNTLPLTIISGNALSGNTNSGTVFLGSGNATGSGNAGNVLIDTGTSTGSGTPGTLTLSTGIPVSGVNAKDITIAPASGSGGTANGGNINLNPGTATGSGSNGTVNINSDVNFNGTAWNLGANGLVIFQPDSTSPAGIAISLGNASAGNNNGADYNLTTGSGDGSGNGGSIDFAGGQGGASGSGTSTGLGGSVEFDAGLGGDSGGAAGNIIFQGANSVDSQGTIIKLEPGNGPTPGFVSIQGVSSQQAGLAIANGNIALGTAGNKLMIATGTNGSAGTTGNLSGGSITVPDNQITSTSLCFFTTHTLGTVTVPQSYRISARTAGTSFTIQSSAANDTSTVDYLCIN